MSKVTPSDEGRKLARRIVKEAPGVRVKFGNTNGRECLHVYIPGATLGRTIYSAGEWENHPANPRVSKGTDE